MSVKEAVLLREVPPGPVIYAMDAGLFLNPRGFSLFSVLVPDAEVLARLLLNLALNVKGEVE